MRSNVQLFKASFVFYLFAGISTIVSFYAISVYFFKQQNLPFIDLVSVVALGLFGLVCFFIALTSKVLVSGAYINWEIALPKKNILIKWEEISRITHGYSWLMGDYFYIYSHRPKEFIYINRSISQHKKLMRLVVANVSRTADVDTSIYNALDSKGCFKIQTIQNVATLLSLVLGSLLILITIIPSANHTSFKLIDLFFGSAGIGLLFMSWFFYRSRHHV